ncbi:glycosyltransferase [Cyclobacterium xiamenense]|uniref:glycosyltransferase n=1 Tax=Cyclobacterium xiamenense TaxID=1297121 RepID=UPI0012B80FBB|nr:glycosyltransferase [Cyclobacterium xiamenense]
MGLLIAAVCIFVLAAYLLGLVFLAITWDQLPVPASAAENPVPDCTVLVPFRNEAPNLAQLLPQLARQLPHGLPVIFINDQSEDGGEALVNAFISERDLAHWRCMTSEGIGKKAALRTGIEHSTTALILTTDADVQVPSTWVRSMLASFEQPEVQLVAGPVIASAGPGVFGRFQPIEWASIGLMTAVSFFRGNPLMCSAANLAFRRAAFYHVSGYKGNEHLLSGDDEFLMKKILAAFGAPALRYSAGPESLVTTRYLPGVEAWIAQRSRWASKWNAHRSWGHAASAGFFALVSLCQLAVLLLPLLHWTFLGWVLLYCALKFFLEKRTLGRFLRHFGKPVNNLDLFLAGWLYPLLVVRTVPRAISGKYTWKGRKN